MSTRQTITQDVACTRKTPHKQNRPGRPNQNRDESPHGTKITGNNHKNPKYYLIFVIMFKFIYAKLHIGLLKSIFK